MEREWVAVLLRRSGGSMGASSLCGKGHGEGKEAENSDSQCREPADNVEGKEGTFGGEGVSTREGGFGG